MSCCCLSSYRHLSDCVSVSALFLSSVSQFPFSAFSLSLSCPVCLSHSFTAFSLSLSVCLSHSFTVSFLCLFSFFVLSVCLSHSLKSVSLTPSMPFSLICQCHDISRFLSRSPSLSLLFALSSPLRLDFSHPLSLSLSPTLSLSLALSFALITPRRALPPRHASLWQHIPPNNQEG